MNFEINRGVTCMAIMYPNKPKECSINSKEDLMFEALEKLSDTYYVFHSLK